jgi:hypothetical protein
VLQAEGVEAWDCAEEEQVLIVPWILALLGDNPMQSELSSHIGLTGNCFCRICKIDQGGVDLAKDADAIRAFLKVSPKLDGCLFRTHFQ